MIGYRHRSRYTWLIRLHTSFLDTRRMLKLEPMRWVNDNIGDCDACMVKLEPMRASGETPSPSHWCRPTANQRNFSTNTQCKQQITHYTCCRSLLILMHLHTIITLNLNSSLIENFHYKLSPSSHSSLGSHLASLL